MANSSLLLLALTPGALIVAGTLLWLLRRHLRCWEGERRLSGRSSTITPRHRGRIMELLQLRRIFRDSRFLLRSAHRLILLWPRRSFRLRTSWDRSRRLSVGIGFLWNLGRMFRDILVELVQDIRRKLVNVELNLIVALHTIISPTPRDRKNHRYGWNGYSPLDWACYLE